MELLKIKLSMEVLNMKKNPKKLVFALIISLVVFATLACSGKPKTTATKYSLNVGRRSDSNSVDPIIDTAGQEHLFEKYGLSVNFVGLPKSSLLNSVAVGKIDASYLSILYNLNLGANGEDVILFAGTMSGGQGVLAHKKVVDEVKDPANWKGRIIAGQIGGTGEMVIKSVLNREYKYVLDTDYKYKSFETDAETITACAKGGADVIIVSNNFVDAAIQQGFVYLFPLTDLEDDFVCCRQMANGTHFKNNREAYLAWMKTVISAYKIYKTEPARVTKTLEKLSGQTESWLYDFIYNLDKNQRRFYSPDPNYNGVKLYYDTMINLGYIETERELPEFFDISLYAQALREVIEEYPDEQIYKDLWAYFVTHNDQYPNFKQDYPETL